MAFTMRGDQDILYRKTGATTYVRVPNILNFSEQQPEKSTISTTNMFTPKGTVSSVSGRPNGDHRMTYNIQFDPTNAEHQALKASSKSGTVEDWVQVFRNDDGTAAEVWTFSGEVASLPVSGGDNAVITSVLTINCTATPNYNATLPTGIPADITT